MLKFGPIVRVGAGLAVGGLLLGLTAIPAGSQVVSSASLDVSGTVSCEVVEGAYTWVFDYTATNTSQIDIPANAPAALGDITIDTQNVTLDGSPAGVTDLLPNPIAVGQSATFHGEAPGVLVGTVVLTVEWSSVDADASGTEVVTLVIDDSCHAPASTTTTTTAPAVQAEAVAVTPSFTG